METKLKLGTNQGAQLHVRWAKSHTKEKSGLRSGIYSKDKKGLQRIWTFFASEVVTQGEEKCRTARVAVTRDGQGRRPQCRLTGKHTHFHHVQFGLLEGPDSWGVPFPGTSHPSSARQKPLQSKSGLRVPSPPGPSGGAAGSGHQGWEGKVRSPTPCPAVKLGLRSERGLPPTGDWGRRA